MAFLHHLTRLLRQCSPLTLLGALALWLVALAGIRPLTLPDEGRYAGVAWEMYSNGSWLTPLMDGMPYFHKPPLYYWLASASYAVFGAHPWSARLPAAFAALLAIVGVYVFLKRVASPQIATRSAVMLATTPLFYGAAQFANHDMLVAAFITLSIVAGAWALGLGDLPHTRHAAAGAALFAALAVLSKGLIGVALPGITLLIWAASTGRLRNVRRLLAPLPILLFVLAVVPWFAVMQSRHPDFFHYFFIYQQFERFAAQGFNNVQPVWFYFPVLAIGSLPWAVLGLHSAWQNRTQRKDRTDLHATGPTQQASQNNTRHALTRLAWIWLAVITLFFSIPGSKLVGYILPAFPPLIILIACAASNAMACSTRRWRNYAIVAAALCITMPFIATLIARPGTEALAKILARDGRPNDIVVALETYPFDLNLLARRAAPMWVVDNWTDPALPLRDNWRKELFDAATFAPNEVGARQLLSRQTLAARLCALPLGSRVWFWARLRTQGRDPLLQHARLSGSSGENGLWRWENTAQCFEPAAVAPASSKRVTDLPTAETVPRNAQRHVVADTSRDLPDVLRSLLLAQWVLRH